MPLQIENLLSGRNAAAAMVYGGIAKWTRTRLQWCASDFESAAYNRSPWYMVPGCVDDDIFSVP